MYIPFRMLLSHLSKPHHTLLTTQQLHATISKTHLSVDPFFATRIIRYYALNGAICHAHQLFDEIPHRSIFLWNSIIRAYAQDCDFRVAFELFKELLCSNIQPDNFTFACVIRACSDKHDIEGLRLVHGGLVGFGYGVDHICCSALVSAYSKLGRVDEARKVFDGVGLPDLGMWNSILAGYGRCGLWSKGVEMFNMMRNVGIEPDGYAVVGLLSGLAEPSLLEIGQGIHGLCVKGGFLANAHVGSSLVTMYSRCACLDSAQRVFSGLERPDLVTWSALITGMIRSGDVKGALLFFRSRNMRGSKADPVLVASTLMGCAQLVNVGPGSEIHGYVLRHGLEMDFMVSSALIDMYSKCGFVDLAIRVLNILTRRNIVCYNAAILGLGSHGKADVAFRLFNEALEEGFSPDESTFSALLHACSQAGLVKPGEEIFNRMKSEFGIEPRNEHYVHMVKILGMVGRFDDAYDLIQSLPQPVDAGIWGALLACCETHGNAALAEKILQDIYENQQQENTYSVQLSNMYANHGRWDDAGRLRDGITDSGRKKMPGLSWI